jgi:hypothetical protein
LIPCFASRMPRRRPAGPAPTMMIWLSISEIRSREGLEIYLLYWLLGHHFVMRIRVALESLSDTHNSGLKCRTVGAGINDECQ